MKGDDIANALDRAAALDGPRLAFFSLCALFWCLPLFATAGSFNEHRDAHVLAHYEHVAVRTVRDHAQVPLWDPYYCGGQDLLGSPQTRHAAPTFLLSLVFGARRAESLIAFVLLVLGMEGFFRYTRVRTAGAFGPAVVAPLFAGNGFFVSSFFMGWLSFFGFALMPWVLYGVARAVRGERTGVASIALPTAFMIAFGGTHSAPMTAIFATFELGRSVLEQGPRRRATWRGVSLAALGAFLAAAISAVRLWPIAEMLTHAPRIMAGAPHHSLEQLATMAFREAAPSWGNPNLTGILFLGACAAALAPFGLFGRRAIAPLLLFALSVLTAMGYELGEGPFVWLREVPLFEGTRYPFRFLFPAALFLLELGAFGGDAIVGALRKHLGASTLVVAFLGLVACGLVEQRRNVDASIAGMPLATLPRTGDVEFRQARGSRRVLLHYTARNLGALQCWEAYPVPMSPLLRGDLAQEEYFRDPSDGTVERLDWSPNRIALRVVAHRPAQLLVNQNWHPGWRSSVGEVVSREGLLAVDLPAGEHDVVLRYLPRAGLGGGIVSFAGLLALGIVVRRRALDRRAVAVAVALPVVGLLVSLAIPEPSWPRPTPRNANHEPIVLDALPPEATPADVRFEVPVRLVGYETPRAPDAQGNWPFRLYFRVEGDVPRSVGVFVHIVPSSGRRRTADHEVIGASLFFANAPRGKILRDAFAVVPGPRVRHALEVGLWHASGDQSRVPIREAGDLFVADSAVTLGTFDPPP
jgi:hypothetical protein